MTELNYFENFDSHLEEVDTESETEMEKFQLKL